MSKAYRCNVRAHAIKFSGFKLTECGGLSYSVLSSKTDSVVKSYIMHEKVPWTEHREGVLCKLMSQTYTADVDSKQHIKSK